MPMPMPHKRRLLHPLVRLITRFKNRTRHPIVVLGPCGLRIGAPLQRLLRRRVHL